MFTLKDIGTALPRLLKPQPSLARLSSARFSQSVAFNRAELSLPVALKAILPAKRTRKLPPPLSLSVLGLTPAEFLASRNMPGGELKKYADWQGFEVRTGIFTLEESLLAKTAFLQLAEGIERAPHDLAHARYDGAWMDLRQFWTAVASSVPKRGQHAVRAHLRALHTSESATKKGAWAPEDDSRLRTFVLENGSKRWGVLSNDLNRTTVSCSNRWRLLQAKDTSANKEPWSDVELSRLYSAMTELAGGREGRKPCKFWPAVARRVGTRTWVQCSTKFLELPASKMPTHTPALVFVSLFLLLSAPASAFASPPSPPNLSPRGLRAPHQPKRELVHVFERPFGQRERRQATVTGITTGVNFASGATTAATTTPATTSAETTVAQTTSSPVVTTTPVLTTPTPTTTSVPIAISTPTTTLPTTSSTLPTSAPTVASTSSTPTSALSSASKASEVIVTVTSIITNADGSKSTSTALQSSAVAVPVNNSSSSSNTGKTWGIVGGVVGGVVVFAGVLFIIWRFTQQRFGDLDDTGDEIKWPELQPDGQTTAANTSTLNPLGTRRTGGAGFDMDGDEVKGEYHDDIGGGNGGGLYYDERANGSYEQVGTYGNQAGGGAYCFTLSPQTDDPYLGPSAAPQPSPQNIYPPPSRPYSPYSYQGDQIPMGSLNTGSPRGGSPRAGSPAHHIPRGMSPAGGEERM
ncbi:hypothetical protein P7C70_g2583, partial [Phenoliferia sp. Uapishka_3]